MFFEMLFCLSYGTVSVSTWLLMLPCLVLCNTKFAMLSDVDRSYNTSSYRTLYSPGYVRGSLTNRLVAHKGHGYGSRADKAKPNGLLTHGP